MSSTSVDFRNDHMRLRAWSAYRNPLSDSYDRYLLEQLHLQGTNRILDAGCGNGRFSEVLIQSNQDVVALDVNNLSTKLAKTRCPKLDVIRADLRHLPFRASVFDRVLCVHNLWYVQHFERAIAEIERILVHGGICIADYINKFDLNKLLDWKFYGMALMSLFKLRFVDLGITGSTFMKAFKTTRNVLYSVTLNSEIRATPNYRHFASRFVIVASKRA